MERETELEDLCIEVKENILSRIPLKPRTRLKCVSNNWYDIINGLRRFIPPTTTPSGFVMVQNPRNSGIGPQHFEKATFITVKHQGIAQISFDFYIRTPESPELLDSRNGLLLYSSPGGRSHGDAYLAQFYVCSPIRNWWRPIPPRPHPFSVSDYAKIAFDGSQTHFKVIHYLGNRPNCGHDIHCLIFSSETFRWREVKFKIFYLKQSVRFQFFRHSHSLYMQGKLYGTWNQYMMVHHVERDNFKLVTLPLVKSTNRVLPHHKILWESEEHIFCCQLDSDGFHIWSCIDDDDNGDEELKWQFKQSFMLKELESQDIIGLVEEERKQIRLTGYGVRLLGFNYELQRLYMELPHLILSYSFETRKMAKVLSYNSAFTILPFLFNPVCYLPAWDGSDH